MKTLIKLVSLAVEWLNSDLLATYNEIEERYGFHQKG